MAEETKDQTGEEQAGAADQQPTGDTTPAAGEQNASQDNAQKGLESALAAERAKRQEAEVRAEHYEQMSQVLQANRPAEKPQPGQQAQPDILQQLGMADEEEYFQGSHVQQLIKHVDDRIFSAINHTVNAISGQQFLSEHGDYQQVVGSTDHSGNLIPTTHFTKVLQKKPWLSGVMGRLGGTPEAMRLAYDEVVNDPDYQNDKAREAMTPEQRLAADAATRVQAANQAALSASAAASGGQLDKTAAISGMSEEQLRAHRDNMASQG